MASKTFIKHLKKHILKSAPVVNDFICATLWEFGEVTSRVFFSSNHSFAKPTRVLFGLNDSFEDKKINKNTIRKNLGRLVAQGIVKKKNKKFILSEEGKKYLNILNFAERFWARSGMENIDWLFLTYLRRKELIESGFVRSYICWSMCNCKKVYLLVNINWPKISYMRFKREKWKAL